MAKKEQFSFMAAFKMEVLRFTEGNSNKQTELSKL